MYGTDADSTDFEKKSLTKNNSFSKSSNLT